MLEQRKESIAVGGTFFCFFSYFPAGLAAAAAGTFD
jgi:hypothetical protein